MLELIIKRIENQRQIVLVENGKIVEYYEEGGEEDDKNEGNIYTVEESAKINGSTTETEAIKFGTGSKTGKAVFTAPAGTKKIGFYAIAWNTNSSKIKFSTEAGTLGELELIKNAGFKSSKPYTIELGAYDYYELAADFAEDTEVTVETLEGAERRALLIGLTTYSE